MSNIATKRSICYVSGSLSKAYNILGRKEGKMRRNAGRVEFIAVREEIMDLLSQGHNRIMIYEHLVAKHKITMSYRTFCDYFRSPQKTQPLALPTLEKKQTITPKKNESVKTPPGPTVSSLPQEQTFSERLHLTPEEQNKLF
jgi:hypothetical protein